MILQSIIAAISDNKDTDITPPIPVLIPGVDVTTSSIYWFTPYRSSDFPELICDKNYIFLWSTDHDSGLGSVWWGKGDNLDLSDFEEVAIVFTGNQVETPFLYRFPNNPRVIHLYTHTNSGSLNTCGGQETNLRTTNGGEELHNCNFTIETNPLGCQGTVNGISQNHTGYLRFWDLGNGIIGNHHFNGSVPLTYQRSTTTDGFSFISLDPYTQYNIFLPTGQGWALSWSHFFRVKNRYFGIVNSADDSFSFSGGVVPCGMLHLVEVNSNLEIIKYIKQLNESKKDQGFSVFIDGNTAYLYRQSGRTDRPNTFLNNLAYSTLDITFLNFL